MQSSIWFTNVPFHSPVKFVNAPNSLLLSFSHNRFSIVYDQIDHILQSVCWLYISYIEIMSVDIKSNQFVIIICFYIVLSPQTRINFN